MWSTNISSNKSVAHRPKAPSTSIDTSKPYVSHQPTVECTSMAGSNSGNGNSFSPRHQLLAIVSGNRVMHEHTRIAMPARETVPKTNDQRRRMA